MAYRLANNIDGDNRSDSDNISNNKENTVSSTTTGRGTSTTKMIEEDVNDFPEFHLLNNLTKSLHTSATTTTNKNSNNNVEDDGYKSNSCSRSNTTTTTISNNNNNNSNNNNVQNRHHHHQFSSKSDSADKLIINLAEKLRSLHLDSVELGCLKLILLLNPGK
ncbi:unnamed protein product [Trichobilharzia regenti]|nr:unnamed protein product [Trichobilharzia regenti]